MEQQRPLRLGDLVDDYCPRERRVTNHAIVAIVEDAIRQTRCTACEADHVYKGGKAPARKKAARTKEDEQTALYDQVLANVTGGTPVPPPPEPVVVPVPVVVAAPPPPVHAPIAEPTPQAVAAAAPAADPEPAPLVIGEGWSLNRRLIRASLPRNDSQPPPPRAIPEFTMHQRNVRGSQQFRGGGGNGNGGGYGGSGGGGWHDRSSQGTNGNSNGHRGGFRPDPQGQGQGPGQGEGQPGSPNGQRPGGGRRRRRHKSPRPPQN